MAKQTGNMGSDSEVWQRTVSEAFFINATHSPKAKQTKERVMADDETSKPSVNPKKKKEI